MLRTPEQKRRKYFKLRKIASTGLADIGYLCKRFALNVKTVYVVLRPHPKHHAYLLCDGLGQIDLNLERQKILKGTTQTCLWLGFQKGYIAQYLAVTAQTISKILRKEPEKKVAVPIILKGKVLSTEGEIIKARRFYCEQYTHNMALLYNKNMSVCHLVYVESLRGNIDLVKGAPIPLNSTVIENADNLEKNLAGPKLTKDPIYSIF
jgi:hypothetical protein